jgi:hypothetical protein
MSGTTEKNGTTYIPTREVVGVFPNSGALELAVDQLEIAGVDRAAISVLSVHSERSPRLDALYRSAKAIEDDPAARQTAFVSHDSLIEGESIAIAGPAGIGGIAGAWAVGAAGGALVTAIGMTILGGVVGAGLGGLLLYAVARHHATNIQSQIEAGGLVLWVSTSNDAAEQKALEVLRRCGGESVHTHTIDRKWGVDDTPLHDIQPDPFLEHGPR